MEEELLFEKGDIVKITSLNDIGVVYRVNLLGNCSNYIVVMLNNRTKKIIKKEDLVKITTN